MSEEQDPLAGWVSKNQSRSVTGRTKGGGREKNRGIENVGESRFNYNRVLGESSYRLQSQSLGVKTHLLSEEGDECTGGHCGKVGPMRSYLSLSLEPHHRV